MNLPKVDMDKKNYYITINMYFIRLLDEIVFVEQTDCIINFHKILIDFVMNLFWTNQSYTEYRMNFVCHQIFISHEFTIPMH